MQCSWMFSRWETEQATYLFIPSHTAVIILSAANIRQRRGRHNKNSGKEAFGPSLGAKPVILHLKWSCKCSQVVALRSSSSVALIWWSLAISSHRHAAVSVFWVRKGDNGEQEIFQRDWVRLPDEKLISTVGSTTAHMPHPSQQNPATVCLQIKQMMLMWKQQSQNLNKLPSDCD